MLKGEQPVAAVDVFKEECDISVAALPGRKVGKIHRLRARKRDGALAFRRRRWKRGRPHRRQICTQLGVETGAFHNRSDCVVEDDIRLSSYVSYIILAIIQTSLSPVLRIFPFESIMRVPICSVRSLTGVVGSPVFSECGELPGVKISNPDGP